MTPFTANGRLPRVSILAIAYVLTGVSKIDLTLFVVGRLSALQWVLRVSHNTARSVAATLVKHLCRFIVITKNSAAIEQ